MLQKYRVGTSRNWSKFCTPKESENKKPLPASWKMWMDLSESTETSTFTGRSNCFFIPSVFVLHFFRKGWFFKKKIRALFDNGTNVDWKSVLQNVQLSEVRRDVSFPFNSGQSNKKGTNNWATWNKLLWHSITTGCLYLMAQRIIPPYPPQIGFMSSHR